MNPFSVPKIQLGPASGRSRANADTNFADTEVEELIAMLRETENLEEQGDILQYLVDNQGLDYNTGKLSFIRFIDTFDSFPSIQDCGMNILNKKQWNVMTLCVMFVETVCINLFIYWIA